MSGRKEVRLDCRQCGDAYDKCISGEHRCCIGCNHPPKVEAVNRTVYRCKICGRMWWDRENAEGCLCD